jgi:hypothetical protein
MRRVAGAADGLLLAELEFRRLLPPDPYSPRCTVRGRTIGQARPTCAPTLDILWVAIVRTINTLADGRALGLRSEIELARVHIATVTRAEIRLRHRILADQEINTVLAQRLVDFDGALQRGVIPTIALRLVMDE